MNTYKFIAHTLNVKPHVHTAHSHEIVFTTYLLDIRIFRHQHWWQECSRLKSSYSPDPSFFSTFSPYPLRRNGLWTKLNLAGKLHIKVRGQQQSPLLRTPDFEPKVAMSSEIRENLWGNAAQIMRTFSFTVLWSLLTGKRSLVCYCKWSLNTGWLYMDSLYQCLSREV